MSLPPTDHLHSQSMVQRSGGQHSTARNSTAQHVTAQHSIAQHSATQISTAQHTVTTVQDDDTALYISSTQSMLNHVHWGLSVMLLNTSHRC